MNKHIELFHDKPDRPTIDHTAMADAKLFGGERLMSPRQVAAILGVNVATFRRLVEDGRGPPYYKFGKGLRRYRPSVVETWARHQLEIKA